MAYKTIIVEKKGPIGYLTLNRPDKLNCMSRTLLEEFNEACMDFAKDTNIKVFIIKGAGRNFCAGYDMSGKEPAQGPTSIEWYMWDLHPDDIFIRALWENPKIIIGQVHSFCLAGGGNMISHMDIVYCTEDALFGYPPARYASPGAHQLWPILVGLRKAMYHLTTGNMLTAQEAHRVGFVNEIFPTYEQMEAEVEKTAKTISKLSMAALLVNKRAVHEWYECMGIRTALRYSQRLRDITYGSPPEVLPHGFQDINRVTTEQGMRVGFEYMNKDFLEEDAIARQQMARPDRKP
ncbi:enoyl-CoA hydratase/isomerase family protein [Chloroflexota bacterium]